MEAYLKIYSGNLLQSICRLDKFLALPISLEMLPSKLLELRCSSETLGNPHSKIKNISFLPQSFLFQNISEIKLNPANKNANKLAYLEVCSQGNEMQKNRVILHCQFGLLCWLINGRRLICRGSCKIW